MQTSTMGHKKGLAKLGAALVWLLIWQLAAMAMEQSFLLASPVETVQALVRVAQSPDFWGRIGFSASRILFGYIAALAAGSLLAAFSAVCRWAGWLLAPMVQLMKAVPVASFIILALLWVRSENLSLLIAFLMVLPLVYTAVLEGIRQVDSSMLEMARVFRIPATRMLGAIWLPQIWPYFLQSASVSMGLAWKSGVAAEVIGLPAQSLGESLYQSKLYLETGELFAYTAVIVLASCLCEKGFLWLLHRLGHRWEVNR